MNLFKKFSARAVDALLRKNPNDPDALLLRARRYWAAQDYASAMVDYTQAIKFADAKTPLLTERARGYHEIGKYDLASADCEAVLENDGQNTEAMHIGVASLRHLGSLASAEQLATRWIEIAPDSSDPFVERGVTRLELSDFDGAVSDFQKAISLTPAATDNYLHLTNAFTGAEAFGKAAETLSVVLQSSPDDADLWFRRSMANYRGENFTEALTDLRRARDCGSEGEDMDLSEFWILYWLGQSSNAESLLRDSLQKFKSPRLKGALSYLLSTTGPDDPDRLSEAIHLARDLQSASEIPEWKRTDYLAAALARNGNFEEGISVLSAVMDRVPEKSLAKVQQRLECYQRGTPFMQGR